MHARSLRCTSEIVTRVEKLSSTCWAAVKIRSLNTQLSSMVFWTLAVSCDPKWKNRMGSGPDIWPAKDLGHHVLYNVEDRCGLATAACFWSNDMDRHRAERIIRDRTVSDTSSNCNLSSSLKKFSYEITFRLSRRVRWRIVPISELLEKVCYLLGFPAIFLDSLKKLLTYVPFWKADETGKFFPAFI